MTSQISDVVEKISRTESSVQHRCGIAAMSPIIAAIRAANKSSQTPGQAAAKNEETPLAKAVHDRFVPLFPLGLSLLFTETDFFPSCSSKIADEASNGLIGALLKDSLFNGGRMAQEGGNARGFIFPPTTSSPY